ncbi:hypothetical protein GCM10010368_27890 [Streptomyces roseiscleroticus]|uniref:Uncharacterized protein n=1 Tax=Streptomyces roseiscleroticus TaxID=1972 RepID=A0ABN3EIB4_9ACTN
MYRGVPGDVGDVARAGTGIRRTPDADFGDASSAGTPVMALSWSRPVSAVRRRTGDERRGPPLQFSRRRLTSA